MIVIYIYRYSKLQYSTYRYTVCCIEYYVTYKHWHVSTIGFCNFIRIICFIIYKKNVFSSYVLTFVCIYIYVLHLPALYNLPRTFQTSFFKLILIIISVCTYILYQCIILYIMSSY